MNTWKSRKTILTEVIWISHMNWAHLQIVWNKWKTKRKKPLFKMRIAERDRDNKNVRLFRLYLLSKSLFQMQKSNKKKRFRKTKIDAVYKPSVCEKLTPLSSSIIIIFVLVVSFFFFRPELNKEWLEHIEWQRKK